VWVGRVSEHSKTARLCDGRFYCVRRSRLRACISRDLLAVVVAAGVADDIGTDGQG
jgi:hypothetical protein